MTVVLAQLTQAPRAEDGDIRVIDDIDALGSAEAMLGCGDDNPY
jgi:hypothetical protein